jgi:L-lactate dehydrogenase complex protein LldF
VPEPIDVATARFLQRVGRPLTVLAEPTVAVRAADDPQWAGLRRLAGDVRQHTLDHLDGYLDAARSAVKRNGGHVHLAADAADARRIVSDALAGATATVVASPVCDEIGLRAADAGVSPSAVVVAAAFVVAESGQVCLAGDSTDLPAAASASVLVCVAGIEAVVPRSADLAVMLKVLAQAAGGRLAAGYTVLVGGPAAGPRALHLVLLDNGRSELLAGEHRSVLRCVGCGACTAVCPVYQSAGVSPGGLWAGPVGAIARPVARREAGVEELPHASTLCGACAEACPVRIDLPAHLIALRRRSPVLVQRLRFWAWVVRSPWRYRWVTRGRRWWPRRASRQPWPRPARQSFHDLWHGQGRA